MVVCRGTELGVYILIAIIISDKVAISIRRIIVPLEQRQ